jgi:hypothetical protein
VRVSTSYLYRHHQIGYTINASGCEYHGAGGGIGRNGDGITGHGFKAIDQVGGIECAGRKGASNSKRFGATAGVRFSGDGKRFGGSEFDDVTNGGDTLDGVQELGAAAGKGVGVAGRDELLGVGVGAVNVREMMVVPSAVTIAAWWLSMARSTLPSMRRMDRAGMTMSMSGASIAHERTARRWPSVASCVMTPAAMRRCTPVRICFASSVDAAGSTATSNATEAASATTTAGRAGKSSAGPPESL